MISKQPFPYTSSSSRCQNAAFHLQISSRLLGDLFFWFSSCQSKLDWFCFQTDRLQRRPCAYLRREWEGDIMLLRYWQAIQSVYNQEIITVFNLEIYFCTRSFEQYDPVWFVGMVLQLFYVLTVYTKSYFFFEKT